VTTAWALPRRRQPRWRCSPACRSYACARTVQESSVLARRSSAAAVAIDASAASIRAVQSAQAPSPAVQSVRYTGLDAGSACSAASWSLRLSQSTR
jgi:hypothetical protein